MFFYSLIPATAAVIVGYFVLFSAERAEGSLRRFGQLLAAWMFVLAGIVVLASLVAPIMGFRGPFEEMTEHMQRTEQQGAEILRELREEQPGPTESR